MEAKIVILTNNRDTFRRMMEEIPPAYRGMFHCVCRVEDLRGRRVFSVMEAWDLYKMDPPKRDAIEDYLTTRPPVVGKRIYIKD